MSAVPFTPPVHPVLACAEVIDAALEDVADIEPVFMQVADKREALLRMTELAGRVAELRLRVMAAADDVADEVGARDVAAWLSHRARVDRGESRRDLRLARALERRHASLATAVRGGAVNLAQAEVIRRAVDDLPSDLDPALVVQAEAHLIELAGEFGPRSLRVLGRRVLHVVAPDVADDQERRALEREEGRASRRTFLTSRPNGDGTTDVRIRISDAAAGRLLTYLEAYAAPRRTPRDGESVTDRRPYAQRLGHAFVAFLESADPKRMPVHGGDATTVIVTIDLTTLLSGLGVATIDGEQVISAGEARRLACTASILPAVLGGESEVLDLGRARRLFSPAQRKALLVRDRVCRAEGCDIPAAWCEAHHAARAWARGGRTDLEDGLLLCSWHHHRAHDHRYDSRRLPTGDLRFHRRS